MFQYHIASNYYISLLWGVLMELQVVVACFSAPPKFFSGSATADDSYVLNLLLADQFLENKQLYI